DVYLTLNHSPDRVLARTRSGTLRLRDDEQRGLAFEADLGDGPTAQDVRDMVRRGDLSGASFRFQVAPGGDRWEGEKRTLTRIGELIDLSLATTPAYDGPAVELRTRPEPTIENTSAAADATTTAAQRQEDTNMPDTETRDETTTTEQRDGTPSGGLPVEDRAGTPSGSLVRAFAAEGWPREPATIGWDEFRTASFAGTVDTLSPLRNQGVGLGSDLRYAFPAFPQVAVEADVTSVQVLRQSSRTLPAAAAVIRNIDAVTAKPEVATATEVVTVALKQVAAIETLIPNYLLEQDAIEPLIQTDLRLALNEGLDKLILDAVGASGFQAPGTDPLLISIRKAMTAIQAAGYNPDTLILTPQNAEALDTLRATATAGEEFYVFEPAGLAPRSIYGLGVRISKTVAAPVVADSRALGKLYVSPVQLARFEADAGTTNRSNVRLEGHAAFGVERQGAAIRIAAA
ncbi:MAG: HK97 family phage prohead protease, partial [Thermoleophilaceae bacterium]